MGGDRDVSRDKVLIGKLGETSKFIGCNPHIQHQKSYTLFLNAAASWLQQAARNFDVFPYKRNIFFVCLVVVLKENQVRMWDDQEWG